MISEEQIASWERLANEAPHDNIYTAASKDGLFIEEAYKAVPELIAEVRRLAKLASEHFSMAEQYDSEVDWLAGKLDRYTCDMSVDEWREAARKAVSNEQG